MATNSYSNYDIEAQINALGKRLDKYAKFYWRGEDMWETYHAFITNKDTLKFYNGPAHTNEYSSPQYDHAAGSLVGVKFTRMQIGFTVCIYGVTAQQYRTFIAALGPYEIDYLSFAYDDKLCYFVKTVGVKDSTKTVIGANKNGEDLYMSELNLTFEVQNEQCALAQRQYVWHYNDAVSSFSKNGSKTIIPTTLATSVVDGKLTIPNNLLTESELSFGFSSEITIINNHDHLPGILSLKIGEYGHEEEAVEILNIAFNAQTTSWQVTTIGEKTTSVEEKDSALSIKYDSASGLVYLQYGESDYKILDLLLLNTLGEYIVSSLSSKKVKISKFQEVKNIMLIWELTNLTPIYNKDGKPTNVSSYGRAKTILV